MNHRLASPSSRQTLLLIASLAALLLVPLVAARIALAGPGELPLCNGLRDRVVGPCGESNNCNPSSVLVISCSGSTVVQRQRTECTQDGASSSQRCMNAEATCTETFGCRTSSVLNPDGLYDCVSNEIPTTGPDGNPVVSTAMMGVLVACRESP